MKTYNPALRLVQGMETENTVNAALEKTSIRSESIKNALKSHFVDGWAASMAWMMWNVKQQNFDRAVDTVNRAYRELKSDVNEHTTLRAKG